MRIGLKNSVVASNPTYSLPVATASILGGIKAGVGITITPEGVIDSSAGTIAPVHSKVSYGSTIFSFSGTTAPTVGGQKWYPPRNVTLSEVYFSLRTEPLSDITVQTKKNGVPIGTPIVCNGGFTKSEITTLSITVVPTDYITFDIVSGLSGTDLYVNLSYAFSENFPISSATNLGMVKAGSGVSITAEGILSATGGSGSGGSGLQVLTDGNYFSPDGNAANADYKYVSIGNGSGTDGADYVDIYAFVDFINGVSIRSRNCVFGYFKNPGVVELDRDLYITNAESMGNYFIQGAGVDGTVANGPWSDPITLNITGIISYDFANLTLQVSSSEGLYVGGALAIYPANIVDEFPIYKKLLMGLHPITSINGNNVTVSFNGAGLQNLSDISNLIGTPLNISAACNRTTLKGVTTGWRYPSIYITGVLGNPTRDGGLYNITLRDFDRMVLASAQSSVVFYENVHFCDTKIIVYPQGFIEVWGDVFITGNSNAPVQTYISLCNATYMGWSDHYISGVVNFFGSGSEIILDKLVTSSDVNLSNWGKAFTQVGLVNPSIGGISPYVPPPCNPGSYINVASSSAGI